MWFSITDSTMYNNLTHKNLTVSKSDISFKISNPVYKQEYL